MNPPETLAFHFDPICPWAWLTSRWATRLEEIGAIEVEWRLFSLGVINLPEGQAPTREARGRSGAALESLALARRLGGGQAVARLFTAMGQAAHGRHESLDDPAVLDQTWAEAGLDPSLRAAGAGDPTLWDDVLAEHQAAVAACQAFGVPTLILDAGAGPGIFGPVISEVPADDEALALLEDVLRMARRPYLMELKRERGQHASPASARAGD